MIQSLDSITGGNNPLWYMPLRPTRLSYVPQQLTELNGFGIGSVEVPRHLYLGPQRTVQINDERATRLMYANVIENATGPAHMAYLNRHILIRHWRELCLTQMTRTRWEERFAILR